MPHILARLTHAPARTFDPIAARGA